MHDCGKITTPVHVVNKATKLEAIFDRINLIEVRFEAVKRDAKITFLEDCLATPENKERSEAEYHKKIKQMGDDLIFLRRTNTGSEFMKDEDIDRVKNIAKYYIWTDEAGNR